MTFFPAIPLGGFAGWRVFERTIERQQDVFASAPEVERAVAYFKENAASAESVEKLVADRRLLSVALGAFGLEEEIDKKAYIRRVLEQGVSDPDAFANKIADPRWKEMSAAFRYGDVWRAAHWRRQLPKRHYLPVRTARLRGSGWRRRRRHAPRDELQTGNPGDRRQG